MTTSFQNQAIQAVKKLRVKQIEGLMSHLRTFGPLAASNTTVGGQPAIDLPNPFLPQKNPRTKNWRKPVYSLRRQAQLVKMANETDTLHLLPPGLKTRAFQTRMERLKLSLSPSDTALLAKNVDPKLGEGFYVVEYARVERQKAREEAKLKEVGVLKKEELKKVHQEHRKVVKESKARKVASLEGPPLPASAAVITYRKASKAAKKLTRKEARLAKGIRDSEESLAIYKPKLEKEELWKKPVAWVGELPKRKAGTELGIRLYAGRKRMFKGHAWERRRAERVAAQAKVMRSMPARIATYKSYYKKRKPNPLRPPRLSKSPKLPY